MRHRERAAGFTFVEIVVAVLILTASVLVFAGVMTASSGQSRAGGAATQAPLLATHILETLKGDLKNGTLPACGATGQVHTRSGVEYQESRYVSALVVDEATGRLTPTFDCADPDVRAYRVDVELYWVADGATQIHNYSETIGLDEHTAPRIDRFEASTTLVLTPQDANANRVTLSWDVPVGGQPLDVRLTSSSGHAVADLPYRGEVTVNVSRSTVFTLTASNPAGTHALELTVYAADLGIDAFGGAPAIVGPNEPVVLTWATDLTPDPRFHTLRLQPLGIDVTGLERYEFPSGISATTGYTLEVFTNHESGMLLDSHEATVTFSATPVVHTLTRTPAVQCAPGANVTLAWDVSAGHRVELDTGSGAFTLLHEGTNGPGQASVPAAPPGTHTWTVRFTNRVGTATTRTLSVTSTPLPVITQTLTPNPAVAGVEVLHAWNVDHATAVTLNGGAIARTGSSAFRAIPGVTGTSYAIAAQNDGCTPTPNPRTSTLTIQPIALTNVTLTTAHASPAPGESATVAWATTNTFHASYHRVRVLDQNGTVHYSGSASSASFALPSAGTFTFTVRLETTEATPRLLHSVTLPALTVRALPVINGFTLPASVCAPDPITASWSTSNASAATLNGATVSPTTSGSASYAAPHASPRAFTFVARNAGGRTTQQSGSVAIQPVPVIHSFTISNATPAAGETVTLAWNVSHASSVTLNGVAVSASGSTTSLMLAAGSFELRAEPIGPCGAATRATRTLTANTRVPSISSFAGTTPILVGQSSTLSATLANFDPSYQTATILAPVDQSYTTSSISQSVTPASSTTYTLRITSKAGGHQLASQNATVVVHVPTISVLTLASGYSNPALNGAPHALRYTLEHFDAAVHQFTIAGPTQSTSPSAASGTWVVPDSDRTDSDQAYVAEVRRRSNGELLAERSYTIAVAAAPTASFTRTPDTTTVTGADITLAWAHDANWSSSYHFSRLFYDSAWSADLSASGTQAAAPTRATNGYYLRIWRRSDNAILQTYSFVHTTMPLPTVASFALSATRLCGSSQSVTATWSTANASSVTLYNSRDGSTVAVAASGSQSVTVAPGGFVRLNVSNAVGSAASTVNVVAGTVPSVSLSISPTTVTTGQTFTLSWSTSGTDTRSLTSVSGPGSSGTATRSQSSAGTFTYTLTGTSVDDCSASVSRSVVVKLPPVLNLTQKHTGVASNPAAPSFSYFDSVGQLVANPTSTYYYIDNVPLNRSSVTVDYRLEYMGATGQYSTGMPSWSVYALLPGEAAGSLTLPKGTTVTLRTEPSDGDLRFSCRPATNTYVSGRTSGGIVLYLLYDGTRVRVQRDAGRKTIQASECGGTQYALQHYRVRFSVR